MKRSIATALLLGYVLLVPFCFFGGAMMASADMMHMAGTAAHEMNDCGMSLGGCTQSTGFGGIDSALHHVWMYNSITQTPLTALIVVMTVMVVSLLLAFGLFENRLHVFFSQRSLRSLSRRVGEPRSNSQSRTLHWLSLFETSPNFA